jgi:hypothetical protein
MSPVIATRRRADEFEAVVGGLSTPTRTPGASAGRYDDLLVLVGALRAVPQPQARPEFVAELRTRLLAEAAAMPARATEVDRLRLRTPDPGRVRNPRERRLAVAMGGFALVGATATMSVVAQSALPGDAQYPLKRGIESAHAGISVGDENKGATLLASARTRLDEVSRLGEMGAGQREAEIADTLDDFTDEATEASDLLLASYAAKGDATTVTELRGFTAASMESLSDLDGVIPSSAEDEYVHAVTTLVRIDDEASLACPTCEGVDLDELAPTLQTVGTGFGTSVLPAVNLPDVVVPSLALPSLGGELPPGSVTQPSPTGGSGGGPTGGPTGGTTTLPTPLPSGVPTSGVSTGGQPTGGATTGTAALPTDAATQLLDDITGGPTPVIPLPSVDVTQLLGGVGSALPTAVTSPLGDVLP